MKNVNASRQKSNTVTEQTRKGSRKPQKSNGKGTNPKSITSREVTSNRPAAKRSKSKTSPRSDARIAQQARTVIYNPSLFEIIPRAEVARVCQKDYPVNVVTQSVFDENVNNLYVMLNTWLCLATDLGIDHRHLLHALLTFGIKTTLQDLEDYRYAVLSETDVPSYRWLSFLDQLPVETVSIVCGFPKRTLITDNSNYGYWRDFRNANRDMSNRCYSFELAKGLSEWISIITNGYEQDTSRFILPPGATQEGAHTYLEKFRIVKSQAQWLRDHNVALPEFHEPCFQKPSESCRYLTVPKNAFKRRGIAPEPVSKQVLAYQVDAGVRKLHSKVGIDLSDQERNQFAAFVGSLPTNVDDEVILRHPLAVKYPEMVEPALKGVRVATIDMSAASDSIRAQLVVDIYDGKLYEDMLACRSRFVSYDDDVHHESIISHRWSTMGSANTFFNETNIFTGIRLLAYEYYNLFVEDEDMIFPTYLDTTYGDDCTIDVRVAQTFIDLLECFGFTVNKKKTYTSGSYRESCGKEYLNGKDVTIEFFPRGTSRYELPELVSLQHKLHDMPRANGFLQECILQLHPKMTYSSPGEATDDIWSERYARRAVRSSQYLEPNSYYILRWGIVATKEAPMSMTKDTYIDDESYRQLYELTGEIVVTPYHGWHIVPAKFQHINDMQEKLDRLVQIQISHKGTGLNVIWQYELRTEQTIVRKDVGLYPDLTEHTTFNTSYQPVPKGMEDECELLMYLLTLGGGIEHVNNSPYTKPSDFIRDRRSLTCKGRFQVVIKPSFN